MAVIKEVGPGRLEIREGGGCLTLFGLLFFATGIFMVLASFGVVTMRSDGEAVTQAAAFGLGVLFTLVGGVLTFGRSITSIDVGQQVITKQWRILLPVRTWTYQLGDYNAVTLAFVRGDSDSADKYPIGLKGNAVAPLPLCSPTQYAEARQYAAAVARHLGLDIDDTSTDHPSRVTASEVDAALRDRLRSRASAPAPARPSVMKSDVSDGSGSVRIFRTRTVAALSASEILDVDYSTKESLMTSARRSAEAEASTMRQTSLSPSATGANTEWVFTVLNRFLKGKGIVVKTRKGLTTFGEGLADDEIQYLHSVVRLALAGTSG